MNRPDIRIYAYGHALIRIWANQGMPAIPVWATRMRMGSPYAYGLRKMPHMRMGTSGVARGFSWFSFWKTPLKMSLKNLLKIIYVAI